MSTDAIADRKEQVRTILERLVRIPSVNPPGGELPVAELLAEEWGAAGFDIELEQFAPGRANVIGRQRWGPGPSLLLNGHMDVQPPGQGWTHDPFAADVVDGRLIGQGAEDMKAGLAAFTAAAVNYASSHPSHGELILTAVADEVSGGVEGTRRLVDMGIMADFAVVCEPTGSELYVAHRGALWLELQARGRSAHGGRPWLGQNAINVMFRWLAELQNWAPTELRRQRHALLPENTLNIGSISGGHKINIVADVCTAKIDVRFLPEDDPSHLADMIAAMGMDVSPEGATEVRVIGHVEPMETAVDSPLVSMCRSAYLRAAGEELRIGSTAGFQDAHYLANDLGIPTVMFGPFAGGAQGDDYPSLSGQPDESVSLDALARTVNIYEEMIYEVLNA